MTQAGDTEMATLVASLTETERSILGELVAGASPKSIAASCSVTREEVVHATTVLFEKLRVRTTAEAVRIGIYARLQEPD